MNKKEQEIIKNIKELEGFSETPKDMEKDLESLDIPSIAIDKNAMKITKADFKSRTSNVGIVNVAIGLPINTDIHDVIKATVEWFISQGFILIPDFSLGKDYQGIEHFRKISEETIFDTLRDDRKENELRDYIRSHAKDDKILISIVSCWMDPRAEIWLVTAIINDATFSFNPLA